MAIVCAINQDEWNAWLSDRPQVIKDMAASHPPNRLYRMADTGHRCTIISYGENRTCRVSVTGTYNRVLFSREVFGIPIDTLTECDLPTPDEDVGDTCAEAGYDADDIQDIIVPMIQSEKTLDAEIIE